MSDETTPGPVTDFKVDIGSGTLKDLNEVFHPLEGDIKAITTGFQCKLADGSIVDLNELFEPIESGEGITFDTDLQVDNVALDVSNVDLSKIFCAYDKISRSSLPPDLNLENGFEFDADWVLLTYTFTDGRDLDTITALDSPIDTTGVGWCRGASALFTKYATWGGDNLGVGQEAVLVDIKKLRQDFPDNPVLKASMSAWWYGSRGNNPVWCTCTFWKGGTPTKHGFSWINTNPTDMLQVNSLSKQITASGGSCRSGDLISFLYYDLQAFIGGFTQS